MLHHNSPQTLNENEPQNIVRPWQTNNTTTGWLDQGDIPGWPTQLHSSMRSVTLYQCTRETQIQYDWILTIHHIHTGREVTYPCPSVCRWLWQDAGVHRQRIPSRTWESDQQQKSTQGTKVGFTKREDELMFSRQPRLKVKTVQQLCTTQNFYKKRVWKKTNFVQVMFGWKFSEHFVAALFGFDVLSF